MKSMLKCVIVSVYLVSFFVSCQSAQVDQVNHQAPYQKDQTQHQVAIAAADSWVALLDAGKYGENWKASSDYFKKKVPEAGWLKTLNNVRKPLGKALSRTLESYSDKKGDVGLVYRTAFENKVVVREVVSLRLDGDGLWKADGYFLK